MINRRMTRCGDYLSPDKYLTIDEVNRLRDSVRAEADQAKKNGSRRGIVNSMLIDLMLETGLRAEEVCCLTLSDMPTHHGKDSVLVRRGKGDIMRPVKIKKSMREKIAEYIQLCRPGAKPNSPLFVNEWGQRLLRCRAGRKGKIEVHSERTARLSYHELYMRIRRIGKRAGIEGLHPHKLRHTFGTFIYVTKKDLLNTQRQMGHSRPEITARYAHVLNDDETNQAEALYSEPDTP